MSTSIQELLKDVTDEVRKLFQQKSMYVQPKSKLNNILPSTTKSPINIGDSSSKDFQDPIRGRYYNSGNFSPNAPTNERHKSGHKGVDMRAPGGTPVYPLLEGIVERVGYSGAGGNVIFIQHPGNIRTYYAHLADVTVHKGEKVSKNTVIGHVGNTGNATGTAPHIHFQVWENGELMNPANYLSNFPKYSNLSDEEKNNLWIGDWENKQKEFKMADHVRKRQASFSIEVDWLYKFAEIYKEAATANDDAIFY